MSKVQNWQLIDIPGPTSSYCFIRTSAPPLTHALTYCSCQLILHLYGERDRESSGVSGILELVFMVR